MTRKIVFITLFLVITVNPSFVCAVNRVALVVGNNDYKSSPLKNPVNDAQDTAYVLKNLGFEVLLLKNADKRSMISSLNKFSQKLSNAEIGIFYFAGHGVQINGTNYLIPVNNNIQEKSEVEFKAIDAGRILNKMEKAGNPLNIVILDACRDNPFKQSFHTSKKGLTKINANLGTVIAYATSPGSVAADGNGRNGTYTKSLLKNLQTPNLNVQQMFNRTGLDVMKKTNKKQAPWVSTTPFPDYYFAMGTKPSVQQNQSVVSPQSQSIASPSIGKTYTETATGMEFVWVEEGCYQMGNDSSGFAHNKPAHKVCVSGFWMGKYEVTQGQWYEIMRKKPALFKHHFGRENWENRPVEQVSWKDTKKFIKRLNNKNGQKFRLPTEAEWEYAARSRGKDGKYSGGNSIEQVAWSKLNSEGHTHVVGEKASNSLGLYDMSGNVFEWCEDVYDANAYSKHAINNPLITSGSKYRISRGGSWWDSPEFMMIYIRSGQTTNGRFNNIGFRLCISQIEE